MAWHTSPNEMIFCQNSILQNIFFSGSSSCFTNKCIFNLQKSICWRDNASARDTSVLKLQNFSNPCTVLPSWIPGHLVGHLASHLVSLLLHHHLRVLAVSDEQITQDDICLASLKVQHTLSLWAFVKTSDVGCIPWLCVKSDDQKRFPNVYF